MRGWVEKIHNGVVEGWIVDDSGNPRVLLQVAAYANGQKLSEGVADIFREDLFGTLSQTGIAGFALNLKAADSLNEQVLLHVIETTSGWEVPPGLLPIDPRTHLASDTDARSCHSSPIIGGIDYLTPWVASGWSRHIDSSITEPTRVEAIVNGMVVCETIARAPRTDLDPTGTSNCGFAFKFGGVLPKDINVTFWATSSHGSAILSNGSPHLIGGFVDNMTTWGAAGWAWSGASSTEPLRIDAVLGGHVIGSTIANKLRDDLNGIGGGTSRGFTIRFARPVSANNLPELYAISDQLRSRLKQATSQFATPPSQSPVPIDRIDTQSTSSLDVEGNVDIVTSWLASGWAWRPSEPYQALEVQAVLDGNVIGSAIADHFRPDLAEHGKGTGRYGFVLSFANRLQSEAAPVFRVSGPEGTAILPFEGRVQIEGEQSSRIHHRQHQPSPSLITASVEGHVDYLTRNEAHGWAWFPTAPEQAAQVEAVLDGKVIGRALANQLRPDLAQHGKGTGLYGFEMTFLELLLGAETPEFRVSPSVGQLLHNDKRLPPISKDDIKRRSTHSPFDFYMEHANYTTKGPQFEEFDPGIIGQLTGESTAIHKPMMIAFYLPQFHAIEENDQFWGKGFTEWRQLPRGLPRFPGHYQPRIPRDLGYYNLDYIDVLRQQSTLAREAGIYGFAYYYYWFNRKRVLERPLDALLNSDIEMPFMLVWANENWTRTWDGSDSQVLLKQDYNIEDEEALIDDLARHFLDPRYIRIDGRPLFVIYNPKNVPHANQTIRRWREMLSARAQVEPLIFMAQTFGELDPRTYELDGALEFPPHKLSEGLPGRMTPDAYSPEFSGRVIDYDDFVRTSLDEVDTNDFPLIKTAVPSWDNDARRPNRGLTLENIAPAKYEAWLAELLVRAIETPIGSTPIVAINAWNEWAEGAYLEPDVYFGAAYLNATARAYATALSTSSDAHSSATGKTHSKHKVTVILPNFNHERYLPERISSVLDQTVSPDEIIFLDDCSSDNSVEIAYALLENTKIPYRIITNQQNSGGVFHQWIKGLSLATHELIWIAETDDAVDRRFLRNILPAFDREDVMLAFGRISCISTEGHPRDDLDHYLDDMKDFSWDLSSVVPAFRAFSHDFAIKNVIPNASGLVFRKPHLSEEEKRRLTQYRFAGDWFFYALVARGGSIAYCNRARSFFRVSSTSTSRSSFFTDRHLLEHQMILQDLGKEYGIDQQTVLAHAQSLSTYMTDYSPEDLRDKLLQNFRATDSDRRIRICLAANSFAVGGGEILPVELANKLKEIGHHVTFLVVDRSNAIPGEGIRTRLRSDIPVFYWDDVCDKFVGFIESHGIEVINSHNVSFDYRVYCRNLRIGIPYIVSLHGGYETVPDLLSETFMSFLDQIVTKWMYLAEKNLMFLPSEYRRSERLVHSFNAITPIGVDTIDRTAFRNEHSIPLDAFVFVQCSRAIESKGWRTSVEIVLSLAADGHNVHLVLIGDGPVASELQQAYFGCRTLTFLGQVDRPIRYFGCFEMGLFPSQFEGETFPLFLLECFEAGLPVATSDIGEIPRIMTSISEQMPGILLDHREEPHAIARDAIKQLEVMFDTPGHYHSYRSRAAATTRLFSMAALSKLYLRVFNEVTGRNAEPNDIDDNHAMKTTKQRIRTQANIFGVSPA